MLILLGEFLEILSMSPEPKDPFIWCESIPPSPLMGPSEPGPSGKLGLLGPGGTAFIKVYMLSPELVESAGLGMMGVPGGPPPPGGPT